ncbi:NF-kappa-B inhibitor-interacting Ras-like protein 1 [Lampetra fluviatilis]
MPFHFPSSPLSERSAAMGKGCRVVVCGQASVGKTAILEQVLYGSHVVGSQMHESQEDVFVAWVETERGVREQVRLYDTRGLRDSPSELPRHYLALADGFLLVYSVDNVQSFRKVEALKKEIDRARDKKEVTVVVLGNKSDLRANRAVRLDQAQQWARTEKVRLWEVSVTDRRTLLEPLVFLASKLTQPPSKPAFPLPRRSKGGTSEN